MSPIKTVRFDVQFQPPPTRTIQQQLHPDQFEIVSCCVSFVFHPWTRVLLDSKNLLTASDVDKTSYLG